MPGFDLKLEVVSLTYVTLSKKIGKRFFMKK
jgi:hypothetical protein